MSTPRRSMYSQVVLQQLLTEARCPGCQETNLPGRKQMIELNELGFYCNRCGADWPAERPRAEPVT